MNPKLWILILLFLSLGSLGFLAFISEKAGYRNLLLIVPAHPGSPRIDIQDIEQFCEEEFLVSYEIINTEQVSLPHHTYPVTLIGTNSVYHHILGLSLLDGAFFSKQAWEGKQQHAALNEKAAFTIFGSSRIIGMTFKMQGKTWIVTGVIQDKDEENCRVYIPASIRGIPAVSLMVLMNPKGEVYTKNRLKILGIQEMSFDFFNLETQTRLFRERLKTALGLLGCVLLLTLLYPIGRKLKKECSALQEALKHQYFQALFIIRWKTVLHLLFLALTYLFCLVVAGWIILQIVSLCLPWQAVPSLKNLNQETFYPKTALLRNLELPDQLIFGGYIIFLMLSWLNIIRIFFKCEA